MFSPAMWSIFHNRHGESTTFCAVMRLRGGIRCLSGAHSLLVSRFNDARIRFPLTPLRLRPSVCGPTDAQVTMARLLARLTLTMTSAAVVVAPKMV